MNLLPKFLTNKSKQMESKSHPSTPTQPRHKSRPRLDRRNAAKNIDYQPPSSSSSSSFSSSSFSSSSDDSIAIRTRSIDVYPHAGDTTSFRINGQDGEFEFLCKSLGFSGPDDFGISPHDYQLMKTNSAPLSAPHLHSLQLEPDIQLHSNLVILEDTQLGITALTSTGVGIKGDRPPAVSLPPPPRMSLPVLQDLCSSFDILRSLGPDTDRISTIHSTSADEDQHDDSTSVDEDQHAAQGDVIQQGDDELITRDTTMGEETGVLSHSSSFTSNSIDDDSSSTTTDPMSISPNGRLRRQITSWDKGKHLGSGSYGSVYEGIADGGFFFAVKEVSFLDHGDKGREIIYQFEQEMALLSQFAHKNIVRYLGTDKDDSNLYIFLELVPQGSLLSLYQRFRFQDSHVSGYTRQILEGLKYLHERNVVHRDIKCANILLDVDGYVKLADFGLAKVAKLNDAKSCKGTSYWMAPEVVKPNQWYGRAADIWSLGCTVLEMLTQNFPYHPLDGYQAMFKIGSGEPPIVPDFLSRDARDFILKCLQVDPDTRPTASDLLEHPFVKRPHMSSSASASPHHHGMQS